MFGHWKLLKNVCFNKPCQDQECNNLWARRLSPAFTIHAIAMEYDQGCPNCKFNKIHSFQCLYFLLMSHFLSGNTDDLEATGEETIQIPIFCYVF
ncbi:MAG TPA: hypothetical protein DIT98_00450 [Verrucomicrobiales bacterium]|nr:hypothetical protein [Verrucomicrobiales bacterium]HCP36287.1 hypothetical protein [Verrucomicrobiales bacterium]